MRHALLIAFWLSACNSVEPSTVAQLSALSPVEADPAGFEIAVGFPPGIDIPLGGARLTLAATRSDTQDSVAGTYTLERLDEAFAPEDLTAEPGGHMRIYRVAEADLEPLRALQRTIRGWEDENDAATRGSLGLSLDGCKLGAGPRPGAEGSACIRVEEGGRFLPVIRRGSIDRLFDAEDLAQMPSCP